MEGDGPGVVEEAAHPAEELGVQEVAATNPGQVFDVDEDKTINIFVEA